MPHDIFCLRTLTPLLLVGLLFTTTSAFAQEDDDARAEAREAYQRGQSAFQDGRYDDAEEAFEEAYDAVPNPVVLLGLASAREENGHGAAAVEALELYLEARDDAPDREEIEGRIAVLREQPATMVITSVPSGATVEIDGEERGTTPLEVELDPGRYTIGMSLDDHVSWERRISADFATRHEIEAPLSPSEGSLIADEDAYESDEIADSESSSSDDGVGAGVWVAAGISVASLVAGTVLGFLALSEQSDFDDVATEAGADRGERFALFADIGFGVAAAAGLTAIVLYVTDGGDEGSDSADLSPTNFELAPMVGPDGAGLGARGRF